jgi:subtilisin family serine protease
MGWTKNNNRRKTRAQRRLELEHLDDRCLLSTVTGGKLTERIASHALGAHHAAVRRLHHGAAHAVKAAVSEPSAASTAAAAPTEKPAGTIEVGAPTAYDPIINAAATRSSYNVDGTGMTVAVIDTGVDYNNPALGGGFGPGNKVVAGFDFADDTGNPMATTSQHGTAIAGLIASDDPSDLGVAPGADIVALRVTDDTNTASLSSVASALQWVITNHSEYNITAVNMSLSDGGNYAQNWFANDGGVGEQITGLVGQLTAMNIPVVVATGNSFAGAQGEGFAAIVAGTISVTATDLSGNLLSNAQRLGSAIGGASATTIAAPGEGLTAPSGDSGTATGDGTSFATALVTGSVTLLQEIYESRFGALPTVAQIKSWLQAGATPIQDPVTGITIGELNVLQSASLIPDTNSAAAPQPSSSTTASNNASAATTTSVTSTATAVATQTGSSPAAQTTSTTTGSAAAVTQVNTSTSGSTGGPITIDTAILDQLLAAMTAWPAETSAQAGQGATQVQVWNATS